MGTLVLRPEAWIAGTRRPLAGSAVAEAEPAGVELRTLPESYAIARLPGDAVVPPWVGGQEFLAVVRTRNELSIVCREDAVPPDLTEVQREFRCLVVAGTLDFAQTGIIAQLAQPLAQAQAARRSCAGGCGCGGGKRTPSCGARTHWRLSIGDT